MNKRTRHCLLVGVNKYSDPRIRGLRYCCNDTLTLSQAYTKNTTNFDNNVTVLSDDGIQPTKYNIYSHLHEVCENSKPNDIIIIHFSCHGATIDNHLYLYQTDVVNVNPKSVKETSISFANILSVLDEKCYARQRFITIDACESGSLRQNIGNTIINDIEEASKERITICFSACSYNESAQEDKDNESGIGNGVFTRCLATGLNDKYACNNTRYIDANSLFYYIKKRMAYTDQTPNLKYHGNVAYNPNTFIISSMIDNDLNSQIKASLISSDHVLSCFMDGIANESNMILTKYDNVGAYTIDLPHIIFIDVRNSDNTSWEEKRLFISGVRKNSASNNVAFILIGIRKEFLDSIPADNINRYKYDHYFFIDLETPYFLLFDEIKYLVYIAKREYDANTFMKRALLNQEQKDVHAMQPLNDTLKTTDEKEINL